MTLGTSLLDCKQLSLATEGPFSIIRETKDSVTLILTLSEACRITSILEGRHRVATPTIGAVSILPPGNRYTESIVGQSAGLFFEFPWEQASSWIATETDLAPERVELVSRLCVRDVCLAKSLFTLAGGRSGLRDEALHGALDRLVRYHSNRTMPCWNRRSSGGLTALQLRRVTALIEDRLGSGPSLDAMASEAKLSKFHFVRAFKATIGITPHVFVLNRRLDRALQALLEQKTTVETIAAQLGFSHGSHLSKMLRLRFGVSPSEYRRSIYPQTVMRATCAARW